MVFMHLATLRGVRTGFFEELAKAAWAAVTPAYFVLHHSLELLTFFSRHRSGELSFGCRTLRKRTWSWCEERISQSPFVYDFGNRISTTGEKKLGVRSSQSRISWATRRLQGFSKPIEILRSHSCADADTDDAAGRRPGFSTPTDPVGWHRAAGRAAWGAPLARIRLQFWNSAPPQPRRRRGDAPRRAADRPASW